jgi:Flp pilus assembly protein TadG
MPPIQRKSFWADERGVNAVEFAMVLPVFIAMMFGVIQTGLALYYSSSVQFSLEKTAREAMLDGGLSSGALQQAFNDELKTFTDKKITIQYALDSQGDVDVVVLKAKYIHVFDIPLVPHFEMAFPVEVRAPVTE